MFFPPASSGACCPALSEASYETGPPANITAAAATHTYARRRSYRNRAIVRLLPVPGIRGRSRPSEGGRGSVGVSTGAYHDQSPPMIPYSAFVPLYSDPSPRDSRLAERSPVLPCLPQLARLGHHLPLSTSRLTFLIGTGHQIHP